MRSAEEEEQWAVSASSENKGRLEEEGRTAGVDIKAPDRAEVELSDRQGSARFFLQRAGENLFCSFEALWSLLQLLNSRVVA